MGRISEAGRRHVGRGDPGAALGVRGVATAAAGLGNLDHYPYHQGVGLRLGALSAVVAALLACGGEERGPTPEPFPTHQAGVMLSPPWTDTCGTACALNPNVTQRTIRTTICIAGWTDTVRPPESFTSALKLRQLAAFAPRHAGDKNWTAATTEEDHRMPLELGGAPSDEHNLSPEENAGAKDADETSFRRAVCAGRLTLSEAQHRFASKWLLAWPDYR